MPPRTTSVSHSVPRAPTHPPGGARGEPAAGSRPSVFNRQMSHWCGAMLRRHPPPGGLWLVGGIAVGTFVAGRDARRRATRRLMANWIHKD